MLAHAYNAPLATQRGPHLLSSGPNILESGVGTVSFGNLIERWRATPAVTKCEQRYAIRLDIDDAARVEALTELFPGLDAETIIADLLHQALDAVESAIPYEAGERVIQNDEFGDPVYEDVGLTPEYVRLLRDKRDAIR